MVKEIVFLFIVLVILFFALSAGSITPSITTEKLNIKPSISEFKNTKLGPKKHVSFADLRHERIFNKVTGNIIGEQYNEL